MIKKIFTLLLASILLLSVICTPIPVLASEIDNEGSSVVMPRYSYTNSASSTLSISSGTATCKSVVVGMSGYVTKIVFTQKLQKKVDGSWTNVKTWTTTKNQVSAAVVNTKSSLSKGTYRLRTNAKVYTNATTYETVTTTSITVIYS